MGKGIIVVDIPADCRDCLLRSLADDCIIGRNVMEYRHKKSKPDWCPINPLPEKKEVCGRYPQPDGVVPSFKMGWNACIAEILKGGRK